MLYALKGSCRNASVQVCVLYRAHELGIITVSCCSQCGASPC